MTSQVIVAMTDRADDPSMEHDLTTLTETVDTHLAGYAEPDRDRRVELLTRAWNPKGRLVDPPLDGEGIDGIADLVDAVLALYPGHHFVRTTDIDAHHGYARYDWTLVGPDGAAAVTGTDVVEVDGDGKLQGVVGFFGDLAPTEATDRR